MKHKFQLEFIHDYIYVHFDQHLKRFYFCFIVMLLDLMHRFNKDIDSLIFIDLHLKNICWNGEWLWIGITVDGNDLMDSKKNILSSISWYYDLEFFELEKVNIW